VDSGLGVEEEKDGLSAALLEDLAIQRTAAMRAELSARRDIAALLAVKAPPSVDGRRRRHALSSREFGLR